jgi:UDP-glucuronate 4-epimerase
MAMWIFTKALFEGRPIPLFNRGEMRRDFTFIDDVVRGVVACLDKPPLDDRLEKAGGSKAPHALYNLGNSRSEDVRRVIELLEAATERRALIEELPMQPGDVKQTHADISSTQRDLGFVPSTSIEEGIPKFVSWFRDYYAR